MNKQGTPSCKNVLSLHERHQSSCDRGLVASQQVSRMFSSKNPDDSLEALVCCPYIPPTLCVSITFEMSLNDVMIICFHLLVGKTLHMCRRAMPVCLHSHQHFSTATHEPFHQFHIPNFESVTYIYIYIEVVVR